MGGGAVDLNFDYKTARAAKARFNRKYGKVIKIASLALVFALLVGGLGLIYIEQPIGVFVFMAALWPLMIHTWQTHDLAKLKPSGNDLSGILDSELLGGLPPNPNPRDILTALATTTGGRFFAGRFGLPAGQLIQLASDQPGDTAAIWAEAIKIHQNLTDQNDILSSATVMAALARVSPNIRQVLPRLQLDENDMIQGAEWYAHLTKLLDNHATARLTGGIARDWSFGYIPTLKRFGTNLSEKYTFGRSLNVHLEAHGDIVSAMIETFSTGGKQNVALIGPLGSGKTTVVEAFAEKLMDGEARIPKSLQYRQVISLDSSALLSAAPGRGELEQLINIILNEAYVAKNVILCLDNAQLFFEEGTGSVDITNILLPILEGGAIRLILTMEEQKFLQISQRNAALAAALNRLQVNPPDRADVMEILEDQILAIEVDKRVTFTYQSLTEAYKLSERYVQDVQQPKRSIQLLESGASKAEGGLVTAQSIRDSIESTMGVKIGATDDAAERQQLLNLEDLIHERMINQVAAVNAVSAALRRARAGVRSENRPIGTFLFLGPTGVGKTELAKTLSEVYFGGESDIVRIDMNEYVRSDDVARLIADGANDPNSLTAQIRKNPFSVVLLDEIEKAHPNVLSTLLQVLDEGILRDINNREISFRDAILIATSNAGSDRIRAYIDAGQSVEQFQEQFKNELIDSGQFTPEFLNRYDEIIVFRPLTKEELLQVVGLQLKGVNKTLSAQKVSVNVADDAKVALVDAGYDPRLGARPMRRVVQKTVENIVSQKLLSGELQPGMTLDVSLADIVATGELENAATTGADPNAQPPATPDGATSNFDVTPPGQI
ncbi:MAG: AAA family ATPase [Candidatus Nomurabacteria bacterium]|jgi:ATP-dependent Clp protease ATP-binding subunit ClpC|nr:AAA family ATPase [Candidatus Nomurabacteria bacterium]